LPVLVAYLAWTVAQRPRPAALVTAVLATLALAATLALTRAGRDGWAFAASAVAIGLTVITLFAAAYPNVLPSTTGTGGLTVQNAAAGRYPLKIMTWLAGFAAPLVLAYQTWTYWVFRRRVRPGDISAH
jgi:cytochrome d ubiquinol oxidase subunit II